ncbi:MAG: enoyl-CoA hydratase/isomerase family protein [Hyphomicrobiaceae bacterium]
MDKIGTSGSAPAVEGLEGSGLDADVRGAELRLTLARGAKLNAIDSALRTGFSRTLHAFARDPMIYALVLRSESDRAFSVGGDVRELSRLAEVSTGAAARWIADECALIWQLDSYPKPMVSLINGVVMGTGAGLALVGTHQVAGENYGFQMPETAIGWFPDVGFAHAFARMPHEIGAYLALTGRRIGAADAYRLGLVSHCIPSSRFDEIENALADAQPLDPILDDRHQDPGPAPIDHYAGIIEQCFSADTAAGIVDRLSSCSLEREWCEAVRRELLQRSPLALEVSLRHIRQARDLDLRQTLIVDHRIGCRLAATHDFKAGVRSLLVERTGVPQWNPACLDEVTPAMIGDMLAPMRADEALDLPTRQEMQALVAIT